jgi:hypothetical protein
VGSAVLNEQLQGFTAEDVATLTNLLGRLIANGSGSGESCELTACASSAAAEQSPAPQDGEA